jgi:hypothetical protein
MYRTLWILILCTITGNKVMSQCAPASVPVFTCSGTPLQNNVNIHSGDYYVSGSGGNFSNINLAGGRLIICGNATFSNLNFNGGQVIVKDGANVTISSHFNMGSKHELYNYGTITFNTGVALSGIVYNHSGATMNVLGENSFFNNGNFINNGTMNFIDLMINGGAEACLGNGSQINARNIFNNPVNTFKAPSGSACVSYSGTLKGNSSITATSNVKINQNPGAADPVPRVIGAAIVNKNSPGCSMSLPLTLTSFTGSRKGDNAELNWTTSYEEQVKAFFIEQSTNGRDYATVKEIPANNRPSAYRSTVALAKDSYFRLRMVDIDGTTTFSPIVVVQQLTDAFQLAIQSNPVRGGNAAVVISTQQNQQGTLLIVDNSGRMIRRTAVTVQKGDNRVAMDLSGVNNGQYFLYFQGSQDRSKTVSLIKM